MRGGEGERGEREGVMKRGGEGECWLKLKISTSSICTHTSGWGRGSSRGGGGTSEGRGYK